MFSDIACPYCRQIGKNSIIESKVFLSPTLKVPLEVEFRMTICPQGHEYMLPNDFSTVMARIDAFEELLIKGENPKGRKV